ncbi:MAG: diaminopimelate epimerase [Vampirovibrionales bacterium]|nr:diaminopimelate epimerase [Vampirovibrionales bacterium]
MTSLPFVKMHGLGNDFVMLRHEDLALEQQTDAALSDLAKQVCDRHWGVGADGLIVALPASEQSEAVRRFAYWNSDGSVSAMCGNGIRCFALYLKDLGLVTGNSVTVETAIGLRTLVFTNVDLITVDMGAPILEAQAIPADWQALGLSSQNDSVIQHAVTIEGQTVPITLVNMGNPHCVIFQDDLGSPLDPTIVGPLLEVHSLFPQKTNVEFVTQLGDNHWDVVVWERGCGFTQACGTGACAVAVAVIHTHKSSGQQRITLPGGDLLIDYNGQTVAMTGPAVVAFTGAVALAV